MKLKLISLGVRVSHPLHVDDLDYLDGHETIHDYLHEVILYPYLITIITKISVDYFISNWIFEFHHT